MINFLENFDEFQASVINLASKLPQWNSQSIARRMQSAISSLFEEAGEISGLISKYRTRKEYWTAIPKNLPDYLEVREKFIDETGDLFWVIVCSAYSLFNNKLDVKAELAKYLENLNIYSEYNISFETALFDLIGEINIFRLTLVFDENNEEKIMKTFKDIVESFIIFSVFLSQEYNISLNEICEYNMNKLGNRYGNK